MKKAVLLASATILFSSCPWVSSIQVGGAGGGGGGGQAGGGAGGGSGGGVGGGGGGTVSATCSPTASDNASRDTDCDGLTDAEEYGTYHSDPCNADTDGDGLPDGLEAGRTTTVNGTCGARFVVDADPGSKTNPLLADTDGDGLADGLEDANHNGRKDVGETDPLRTDTDCDGYTDKQERDAITGCATDPTRKDTDGDGLPDGVEGGLSAPGADPAGCSYPAGTFDAQPSSHTNACVADSDGDGIQDGAEDTNHNGQVDPGELDPSNPTDASGPPHDACATVNLKPVNFSTSGAADVQVALVPAFAEVSTLSDGTGQRGFVFYNATTKVAGLVLSRTPVAADATLEEQAARASLGSVSAPLIQTFTTWDGFAASVRGTYDVSNGDDAKARINAIAQALGGGGLTGTLPGTAGAAGPFKVQASVVRRTSSRAVLVVALVPQALYAGQALFTVDDVAGGTALAQFGDTTNVQCEVFPADVGAKVDFVWVVDDSGSMADSQNAVGNAGAAFASKVNSAGLDWRVGAVTTGYSSDTSRFRPFTTDIAVMQTWFKPGAPPTTPPWFGVGGSGTERAFRSTRDYVNATLLPRSPDAGANRIRTGAAVHFIVLSDTDDQSGTNPTTADFITFLRNDAGVGPAVMHGIICPEGLDCGDSTGSTPFVIPNPGRVQLALRATGGVNGDIRIANDGGVVAQQQLSNTVEAILGAAIGGTGHKLSRPAISPTIKVALASARGACNVADVPRDRVNGWDLDSATGRIVFYGNCIPAANGVQVAVSYRFWVDGSPDPDGDACAGTCGGELTCDPGTRTCVCLPNCGGVCGVGLTCNLGTCACDPVIGKPGR